MTLLYRTPNILIDDMEFHATVETTRGGMARRHFRWRKPLSQFKGHAPKSGILGSKFAPFQRHMLQAARGRVLIS